MFNPGINAVIINSAQKNQTKIETTEDLIYAVKTNELISELEPIKNKKK